MIGYWEFKDALHQLFLKNGAVSEERIDEIKGSSIACDVINFTQNNFKRKFTGYQIEDKFNQNIEVLRNFNINISVVSSGLNLDLDFEYIQKNQQFEYFIEDYGYQVSSQLDTEKNEKKEKSSLLHKFVEAQVQSQVCLERFHKMYEAKIKQLLKQNGIPVLNSIVLKENQLAYMLKIEENGHQIVDYVMGSPLIYLMTKDQKDTQNQDFQVIYQINQKNQKFYFYDFQALSENLQIKQSKLKQVLISCMMFFIAEKNFEQNKIINCIYYQNNKQYTHSALQKLDVEFLEKQIFSLNENQIEFERHKKMCEYLQNNYFQNQNFDVLQVYNHFFQIPVFTLDMKTKYYPQSKPINKINYCPTFIQFKQICTFWTLDYLEEPIVHLLNEKYQNMYFINMKIKLSQDLYNVINLKIKNLFQIALQNILLLITNQQDLNKSSNLQLEQKKYVINYCSNIFELEINLNYRKNLKTLFSEQKNQNDDQKKVCITNILNDLKKGKNQKNQIIFLDNDENLNRFQIQKYLNLKLLQNLQYINIEKNCLTQYGNSIYNSFNKIFEQDYILFFEAFTSGILNQNSFLQQLFTKKKKDYDQHENKIKFAFDEIENNNHLKKLQKDFQNRFKDCQIVSMCYSLAFQILQVEKQLISSKIWEMISNEILSRMNQIIFISKVAIIVNKGLIFEKYKDESCNQFAYTIDLIQLAIRQMLKTEMIYLFCNTNLIQDLNFLNDQIKNLQFSKAIDGSVGAFVQNMLIEKFEYEQYIIKNKRFRF